MSSVTEYINAPSSFVVRSRWSCDVPRTDLCTYLFTSPTTELPRTPIFLCAEKPETHNLSMHSYRSLVMRIARGLVEAGLLPGQRVLAFSPNNVFYPSLYLGILAAGGVFTGANPSYTSRELAFQLKDSGASFCLASTGSIKIAMDAADLVGLARNKLFVFDDGLLLGDVAGGSGVDRWTTSVGEAGKKYGLRHWSELVSTSDDYRWKVFTTEDEVNQIAAINYSSGTTGVPKGVEITHKNFIANTVQVLHSSLLSPSLRALPSRHIGVLPMYHAFGQTYYVMICPALNSPLYMLSKFDFLGFLGYVEKYQITMIGAVPPIMIALAKHPAVAKFNLSSVRSMGSGAAPLSAEIAHEVEEKFKTQQKADIKVRQGWGMTEATCSVLGHHPEDKEHDNGSVGELLANCEAKVVDSETGLTDLPANTPGELYIRAPNVCKGYYNNPKATKETFTHDGWLKTGDIAYYSSIGKFYIVDRKKELIKVRGNQVAPAELEGVLLDHPKIADVAVIGIIYANDERPRAYVVPIPGSNLTAREVTSWVEERCTRYKWITGGVEFLSEIPKNPSGKILRKILRERAAKEVVDTGDFRAKL